MADNITFKGHSDPGGVEATFYHRQGPWEPIALGPDLGSDLSSEGAVTYDPTSTFAAHDVDWLIVLTIGARGGDPDGEVYVVEHGGRELGIVRLLEDHPSASDSVVGVRVYGAV